MIEYSIPVTRGRCTRRILPTLHAYLLTSLLDDARFGDMTECIDMSWRRVRIEKRGSFAHNRELLCEEG